MLQQLEKREASKVSKGVADNSTTPGGEADIWTVLISAKTH